MQGVTVPTTTCPLNDEELWYLRECIDPMDTCTDGGIGLYTAARCIVYSYLETLNLSIEVKDIIIMLEYSFRKQWRQYWMNK